MKLDINKQELQDLREEVTEKFTGYVLAAFGLVAGLAWNEAIKALIEQLFPTPENTVLAKVLYAAIITLFVLAVTIGFTRLLHKRHKEKMEQVKASKKK